MALTLADAGWSAYLAPNIQEFFHNEEKAQDLAAWLGFWATLAGAVGGVGFGVIAEKALKGRMKVMLIVLTVLSTAAYLWFALVCGGYVTKKKEDVSIMLYVSCIFGGLVLNGTIPLFYESAVEVIPPPRPPPLSLSLLSGVEVSGHLRVRGLTFHRTPIQSRRDPQRVS